MSEPEMLSQNEVESLYGDGRKDNDGAVLHYVDRSIVMCTFRALHDALVLSERARGTSICHCRYRVQQDLKIKTTCDKCRADAAVAKVKPFGWVSE